MKCERTSCPKKAMADYNRHFLGIVHPQETKTVMYFEHGKPPRLMSEEAAVELLLGDCEPDEEDLDFLMVDDTLSVNYVGDQYSESDTLCFVEGPFYVARLDEILETEELTAMDLCRAQQFITEHSVVILEINEDGDGVDAMPAIWIDKEV